MDIEFKSLDNLYKRLKPALYSKVVELRRMGLEYIKEEDIFNYLSQNFWSKKDNLSISDLTNDILYLDTVKRHFQYRWGKRQAKVAKILGQTI